MLLKPFFFTSAAFDVACFLFFLIHFVSFIMNTSIFNCYIFFVFIFAYIFIFYFIILSFL